MRSSSSSAVMICVGGGLRVPEHHGQAALGEVGSRPDARRQHAAGVVQRVWAAGRGRCGVAQVGDDSVHLCQRQPGQDGKITNRHGLF